MKKQMYRLLMITLLFLSACGTNSASNEFTENTGVNETVGAEKAPSQAKPSEEPSGEPLEEPLGKPSEEPLAEPSEEAAEKLPASAGIDVDLTQLSSTMVYSEVYNMMTAPEDYIGKTIKMEGQFSAYQDQATNNIYYAVIIADATACCSQGLEFIWKGEHAYPEDYPEPGTEITVVGEFQTYEENGVLYCHLIDADLT